MDSRASRPYQRIFLWILLFPVIAANAFCGKRLHDLAAQRTKIKEDYGQVNSFTYGLLSVDVWKSMLKKIATNRIMEFKLTEEQQKILEEETTKVLNGLLTEADKVANKPGSGLGKIQAHFARAYLKVARQNVSKFAESINTELQKPAMMQKLKEMALKQFDMYAASTHSNSEDTANLKRLLAENNAQSVDEFNAAAKQKIEELDAKSRAYTGALIGITLLFGLAWLFIIKNKNLHRSFFDLSVMFAFILLLTSLSMPMMEIDARIKSVDLMLIGEHLRFNEQVIYYRSKSLMQVVKALMESGKVDSVGVAGLIFLFSILFPMIKLTSGEIYLRGSEKIRNSKLIRFFAFKSGKWSMADVTVVAIFMAYIGFESIISHQLQQLNRSTNLVESITTDASSVQPGFVLFTTFVLYSMALSEVLKRITAQDSAPPDPN